MSLLFLFLDGVGLGQDDPAINPFAAVRLPILESLLEGRKLISKFAPFSNDRATLLPLDACLGIDGMPQSATGQAVLLTGKNIPAELGYHYGPKPNQEVAEYLKNGNLFSTLVKSNRRAAFLNAYPPRYFEGIHSGKRLFSSIPLAVTSAGIDLRTTADLKAGSALAADFTAQGWHDHLGLKDTPILTPRQAGIKLARLASDYDFSLFEYWLSDYAGHSQDMDAACSLLRTVDEVIGGLLEGWDIENDLILLTSDHGNIEDLSTRRHTTNQVPALLIGSQIARQNFSNGLTDLAGITPAILHYLASSK